MHNVESFSPWLYGITNNKKVKDSFMKERKKDLFISKKQEISKEKYKFICDKYSGHILERRGFETKPSSSLVSKQLVYLTTTAAEEIAVYTKEDDIFKLLSNHTDDDAQFFNVDILDALHTLHYFEAMRYGYDMIYRDSSFLEGVNPLKPCEYKIDHFSLFMRLFGNTVDVENIIKE